MRRSQRQRIKREPEDPAADASPKRSRVEDAVAADDRDADGDIDMSPPVDGDRKLRRARAPIAHSSSFLGIEGVGVGVGGDAPLPVSQDSDRLRASPGEREALLRESGQLAAATATAAAAVAAVHKPGLSTAAQSAQILENLQEQQRKTNEILNRLLRQQGSLQSLGRMSSAASLGARLVAGEQPSEIADMWAASSSWVDFDSDAAVDSRKAIDGVVDLISQHEVQLQHLGSLRQLASLAGAGVNLDDLAALDASVRQSIQGRLNDLHTIENRCTLDHASLALMDRLRARLQAQSEKIVKGDVAFALSSNGRKLPTKPDQVPASLVLTHQPFSYVLTAHDRSKAAYVEGPFRVELVCPGDIDFVIENSSVSVAIAFETKTDFQFMDTPAGVESLQQDETGTYFAHFPRIPVTFTGKRQFYFSFYCSIRFVADEASTNNDDNERFFEISTQSNTFGHITHADQWSVEAGRLFVLNAFGGNGNTSVPWPYFSNMLQRTFLKETRQEESNNDPLRGLGPKDMAYLEARCSKVGIVHIADIWGVAKSISPAKDTLWAWLGPLLQVLRTRRHVIQLWRRSLIIGLCDRADAEGLLATGDPETYAAVGTFVLRFSESNPGMLACAFVADPRSSVVGQEGDLVKHMVILDSRVSPSHSIADEINNQRHLAHLIHIDKTSGRPVSDHAEDLLQPYFARRRAQRVRGVNYLNSTK